MGNINDTSRQKTIKKNTWTESLTICFLLLTVFGCKKTDNFYGKLQALPQLDITSEYAYKTAYIVGETMVLTGRLQPENNLKITIGATVANIIRIDSVRQSTRVLEQVSVLITEEMVGKSREVKITSGGYSMLGASIDVYTEGGEGSFTNSLTNELVANLNTSANIFLHCINGKGDIYYFTPTDKKLVYLKKDGTQSDLYDLASPILPGNIQVSTFVAGGVTPDKKQLYFSAKTTTAEYIFCKINLETKELTILNKSQNLGTPYEGDIFLVKTVISGIYPDDKGNVYLGIGFAQGRDGSYVPGAIAQYNSAKNRIIYIYKNTVFSKTYTSMPGSNLSMDYVWEFRVNPMEGLLYLMQTSYLGAEAGAIIDVYDLSSRIKIQTFTTVGKGGDSGLNVIAPFSGLNMTLNFNSPNNSYGYLPMPGRRLQVLVYQSLNGSTQGNEYGFPRWVVFDFGNERTYSYAPGRFRMGSYTFRSLGLNRKDELLNYDEAGNLYSTTSGRSVIIKTLSL